MSNVNKWANFLKNEKLDPAKLADSDVVKLLALATKLAESGPPKIGCHADKMESRRKVCTTAFDLSIDLLAMKIKKFQGRGSKPAIGRGLLDVWNEQYNKRFGGTLGTPGAAEVTRRSIVTKLCERRDEEQQAELKALIEEGKLSATQVAERLKLPISYVQNRMFQASVIESTPNVPTPPDMYAKAIRALLANGTTLEYIAERTGRPVEELKQILEENPPCQKTPHCNPSTATSQLGQSEPIS